MVEEAVDAHQVAARPRATRDKREMAAQLEDAIEKLARPPQAINGKPGKLALDALALQMSGAARRSNMSTASSRSASTSQGKADLVIFAPEILRSTASTRRAGRARSPSAGSKRSTPRACA
jgi:hypothetical protein